MGLSQLPMYYFNIVSGTFVYCPLTCFVVFDARLAQGYSPQYFWQRYVPHPLNAKFICVPRDCLHLLHSILRQHNSDRLQLVCEVIHTDYEVANVITVHLFTIPPKYHISTVHSFFCETVKAARVTFWKYNLKLTLLTLILIICKFINY